MVLVAEQVVGLEMNIKLLLAAMAALMEVAVYQTGAGKQREVVKEVQQKHSEKIQEFAMALAVVAADMIKMQPIPALFGSRMDLALEEKMEVEMVVLEYLIQIMQSFLLLVKQIQALVVVAAETPTTIIMATLQKYLVLVKLALAPRVAPALSSSALHKEV